MIITTTSFIPNEEIKSIISVIHSRIVLGTNLFSDISASLTDLFGGKSDSYQKKLEEITKDAINQLEEKGKKLKADALIDLKIDIDEISGGTKSMFMITAIATAVRLNKTIQSNVFIPTERIKNLLLKNHIDESIKEDKFNFSDDKIKFFLINNEYPNAFSQILKWLNYNNGMINWENIFDLYIQNVTNRDLHTITLKYYSKNDYTEIDLSALKIVLKYIQVDYQLILNLLKSDITKDEKRICIKILSKYNQNYIKEDQILIKDILVELKTNFPSQEIKVHDSLLKRGEKYWECSCGNKVSISNINYCTKCNKDIYGNNVNIINLNQTIEHLENIVIALETINPSN